MMKILLVSPYFSPHAGGVENYVLSLALGLKQLGWKVVVVTATTESLSQTKEKFKDVTVYRLPVQFKLSNTPVNLDWGKYISNIVALEKPDIINGHLPVPFMADIASRVAASARIPFVLTYHNDVLKENIILEMIARIYYMLLGDQTLQLASNIIVTSSKYVLDSKHINSYEKKCIVIPPGVHIREVSKKADVYAAPYVLFVGQLDRTHRHKGLTYLLEAMEKLFKNNRALTLKVAGTGDDLEYYADWINKHSLTGKISLLGYVDDVNLPRLYAEALCLCLPSTSSAEGFGMVVLEAAVHKTPSIGSRIGGLPQSILENKTGLLCEPRDSVALEKAVQKLLDSPSLRNKLGERAHARVIADFSWSQQIKKTDDLFRKLLL